MSQPSQTRSLWTAAIGLPLLFASVAALQTRIDAHTRNQSQGEETLLLSSPTVVKKLSLGYDSLLADIYWTRVVQYYGGRISKGGTDFDLLWPLLDITSPNTDIAVSPRLTITKRSMPIEIWPTRIAAPIIISAKKTRM